MIFCANCGMICHYNEERGTTEHDLATIEWGDYANDGVVGDETNINQFSDIDLEGCVNGWHLNPHKEMG
jgi:hypothetical protein